MYLNIKQITDSWEVGWALVGEVEMGTSAGDVRAM